MARSIRSNRVLCESYRLAYVAYKAKNEPAKALEYFDKYITTKDSILNQDNMKSVNEMHAKFDTEKKEKKIAILQKDKEMNTLELQKQEESGFRQKLFLGGMSGGILIILLAGIYLSITFLQKSRTNKLLLEKNGAIYLQKMIIEQKNETITLGFNYAKTIQDKIIPSPNSMKENCGEHFVFFQPKDIVSGDFYWAGSNNGSNFLAAIDCTGHGVPGALMSLNAYDILENICKEKRINEPAQFLDELNAAIKNDVAENANAGAEKFGMDMSLISIDRKKMELQFAGARNPMIIIRRDGSLIETKADRITIGSATEKFNNHTILLQNGDMIYLFSDGYADQIGGPQRKKYLTGNFKNLLLSIADKEVNEQQRILAKTHFEWMGNYTQTDDVMVIGIRV
jgi:serine phosphatase RsbU (regulator of sigma subunit)